MLTSVYPEKITRGAAINTIKRWVPDMQPMDSLIRDFALKLLRRLQSPRPNAEKMDVDAGTTGTEDNMEDGQLPTEALIKTPYLSDTLQLPAQKSQVLQHVELMFALTVKVPEFLDESVFSFLPVLAYSHVMIYSGYSLRTGKWTFRPRNKSRNLSARSFAPLVLHTGDC